MTTTKLTVEEQIALADEIFKLAAEHTIVDGATYASLWGMCRALMTDEQLLTMKRLYTQWITERDAA